MSDEIEKPEEGEHVDNAQGETSLANPEAAGSTLPPEAETPAEEAEGEKAE